MDDFFENTPDDIYDFSIVLQDMLVEDYDSMYAVQQKL
jgi:hypothetical protein